MSSFSILVFFLIFISTFLFLEIVSCLFSLFYTFHFSFNYSFWVMMHQGPRKTLEGWHWSIWKKEDRSREQDQQVLYNSSITFHGSHCFLWNLMFSRTCLVQFFKHCLCPCFFLSFCFIFLDEFFSAALQPNTFHLLITYLFLYTNAYT